VGRNNDVFGFDELTDAFIKMEKKYPVESERLLVAGGQMLLNKTKERTPVGKTKKLKKSWRLKPVKYYKNKTVAVVRVQSQSPVAHLVEYGHEIVLGGKSYTYDRTGGVIQKGKNKGKRKVERRNLNTLERKTRGVSSGGRVEGKEMLGKSQREIEKTFFNSVENLINDLTR
jgi:hypothetical protein